jgi:tyrosine-protein kinase Etk/Wzc
MDQVDLAKQEGDASISMHDILLPIWHARKRILIATSAAIVLTYLVNLFLFPVYYKSTATLLPETEKSKLLSLGQFADVAQKLLGDNIPGSEIARLYPIVVSSETVLRNVALRKYASLRFKDSVDLIQYFELDEPTREENMYKCLRELRSLMNASNEAKTGIVTISVEMREPQLAADVLNTIVAELDNFMRKKKVTTASEQLKWIDVRLRDVKLALGVAEDSLSAFRQANRRVNDSPELLLRQERLLREVQVQSTVFIELKKQFELAKLEEIKNITIVNVLDPGRAPVKKERPTRLLNSSIIGLIVLFGLSAYQVGISVFRENLNAFRNRFV